MSKSVKHLTGALVAIVFWGSVIGGCVACSTRYDPNECLKACGKKPVRTCGWSVSCGR
jgi:hypothetical protein